MVTARSAADARGQFRKFARRIDFGGRSRPAGDAGRGHPSRRNGSRRSLTALARLILAAMVCVIALHADAVSEDADSPPGSQGYLTPGHYPIYSSRFTGSPSPFHETAATLVAKGARRQSNAVAEHLWNEGLGHSRVGSYHLPIYIGSARSPAYAFSCVSYGRCAAFGLHVHLPAGARASLDSDHHITSIDEVLGGEIDGWGGDGVSAHQCGLDGNTMSCSWGGFFPFSGNGLDANGGGSANNGGYAFGLFLVTAQEVLQGHIDHALGMVASCLDNPDIYPADTSKKTDTSCSGQTDRENPQYGQLIRLRATFDIAGSAYSPECKSYLTAFQKYGAYTFDTNGHYGIGLASEDPSLYARPNPWYTKIFPDMVRFGDGGGSGPNFHSESCLNRLTARDLEVYDLAPGS